MECYSSILYIKLYCPDCIIAYVDVSISFYFLLPHSINDNESCAELLLDKAGSELVNCQDNGGRTPIHAAAFNDHVECMQLLLRYNAAADIFDNSGKTPLMMAAGYGHSSAVGKNVFVL